MKKDAPAAGRPARRPGARTDWTVIGVGVALAALIHTGQTSAAADRAAIRQDIRDLRADHREDMEAIRAELHTEIGKLRIEFRTELRTEIGKLREEAREIRQAVAEIQAALGLARPSAACAEPGTGKPGIRAESRRTRSSTPYPPSPPLSR